jgi:hypothetical protein
MLFLSQASNELVSMVEINFLQLVLVFLVLNNSPLAVGGILLRTSLPMWC